MSADAPKVDILVTEGTVIEGVEYTFNGKPAGTITPRRMVSLEDIDALIIGIDTDYTGDDILQEYYAHCLPTDRNHVFAFLDKYDIPHEGGE